METVILGWAAAAILVALGLVGLVLPAIPGAPMIFAGLFLAAWVEDFTHVGKGSLALIGVLALLTFPADLLASTFGAKKFGASRNAAVGAAVGSVVGLFFGLPGLLLGPFVGAFLGEILARRRAGDAVRSGIGATIGLALGVAMKCVLAIAMIAVFALAYTTAS